MPTLHIPRKTQQRNATEDVQILPYRFFRASVKTLFAALIDQFHFCAAAVWRCKVDEHEVIGRQRFDHSLLIRAIEVGITARFDMEDEGLVSFVDGVASEEIKGAFGRPRRTAGEGREKTAQSSRKRAQTPPGPQMRQSRGRSR